MCDTSGVSDAAAVGLGARGFITSNTNNTSDAISLRPVDSVDLTIVVDNTIDYLLAGDKRTSRVGFSPGWTKRSQLVAEHGYSILFTFRKSGVERSILYDAGLTPETLIHNLDALGIELRNLDAIVLSHGHIDHHGGLSSVIQKIGKRNLPLVLHPDAWRNRKVVIPNGAEIELPPPDRKILEREDVQILERPGPSTLVSETALVTGQVERKTDFEKGMKDQYAEENGKWVPDPWVWDDQGIICNINGKGLVVVSSCSHSGVVNILENARRITGVSKLHAFVGGLHLPGGFEQIIPQTIAELDKIRPDIIVPGHCTGWRATHEISGDFPKLLSRAA